MLKLICGMEEPRSWFEVEGGWRGFGHGWGSVCMGDMSVDGLWSCLCLYARESERLSSWKEGRPLVEREGV